jgi:hypothetical protein
VLGIADNSEQTLAEQTLSGNPFVGDEKLHVEFYTDAVENPQKSKEAGRPIFEDTEMVLIIPPGDKDNTIVAPAKMYLPRFRARYQAWKSGQDQDGVTGTLLKEWPGGPSASQIKNLEFFHVRTVEQLAGLSDGNLQAMGPGHLELRKRAQAYLDASVGAASAQKMQSELAKRDGEIEVLKRALKEQNEQIAKIQVSQNGRKG